MKKLIVLVTLIFFSFSIAYAHDSEKKLNYSGMRYGLGLMTAMDSPIIVGNDKGFALSEQFANTKGGIPLSLDDFIFGVPLQLEWMWSNTAKSGIGIKLDLDVLYVPEVDYQSIIDGIKGSVEELIGSGGIPEESMIKNLEHGVRAQLSPMFSGKYSFVKFSFGPSIILDMNVNHLHSARMVSVGTPDDGKDLTYILKKSGLDPSKSYESLTGIEKIAYWGLGVDFATRFSLDFELGKNFVIGTMFDIRFNSDVTKWNTNLTGAEGMNQNFAAVFDPNKFEGLLGLRVLYMF